MARGEKPGSPRRGWRDVEREFKGKRDPQMRVTLPKLAFMRDRGDDGDGGEIERRVA